jgi:hypothetical protein
MNPVIFSDIPFTLSAEEIAPQLHLEPGTEDYDTFAGLLRQAAAVARPKAIYTTSFITARGEDFVELDGVKMSSHVMAVNFANIHRAFPFVMTCGMEVEEWSVGITDMLEGWWVDTLKAHILGKATKNLIAHLKDGLKLGRFSSMNPGSLPDWPITEQTKLFSLLGDVKAAIGVTLTESMLMIPAKSVSGVYFQTESNYENCQLCARENCPGRRKPYDENSYKELMENKK